MSSVASPEIVRVLNPVHVERGRGLGRLRCLPAAALVVGLLGAAPPAQAPKLIVFGGGWGAEGTQASIEATVKTLAEVLSKHRPTVLFAAGDAKTRSVQIPEPDRDETGEILGMLFDRRDNLDVTYRAPDAKFEKAASKANLLDALDQTKADPIGTIVFGVGHGSAETDDAQATLELWGPGGRLSVDALAKHIDAAPHKAPIAFVLGECHSGAFTDIAHSAGDTKAKIGDPARCVLAAVPRDREASGCTADVDDPHARAYVALVAEAFTKKEADFNKDGRVSLKEAHAYAKIFDDTVDVPVSTSEQWLKKILGTKAAKAESARLPKLVEKARPEDQAVLQKLNPFPSDGDAIKSAARQLEGLDKQSEQIQDEIDAAQKKYDRLRRSLLDTVLARFPELSNPYHREARRLLQGDAPEIMQLLKPSAELKELVSIDDSIVDREEQRLELERQAARIERWLNAIEAIQNEDALRKGSKRDVETLDRLLACESLSPSSP